MYVYIKDQAGDTLQIPLSLPHNPILHPNHQQQQHLEDPLIFLLKEKPNKNKNKTMPSQLLTLLLSSMLLSLSTAGLVPLERRAIGCGTCYEVGSKRITINGGNSCYVDCSLQQVDSASEVCCVSFFFFNPPCSVIPCVLCMGMKTV